MKALIITIAAFFAAAWPAAQSREDFAGTWNGVLTAGPQRIPMELIIGDAASIRTPTQGNVTVEGSVSVEGGKVRLSFPANGASFEGALSEDAQTLEGVFAQAGVRLPLAFARGALAPVAERRQTPMPPFPYRAVEVEVANPLQPHVKLAGALTLPQGQGPFPAAVMITGSGAQNRDEEIERHKPFAVIADHLTRRGMAVLRLDDRGVGGSVGASPGDTALDYATDAESAIAFLKARPEIDGKRIGLIGHSLGAMIGAIVAERNDDVAFLVMLAGPSVSGAELIAEQVRQASLLAGASPVIADQNAALQADLLRKIVDNVDDAKARFDMQALMIGRGQPPIPEATVALMLSPGYRQFLEFDAGDALGGITAPVLALYGEKDMVVPPSQNRARVEEALSGDPRSRVVVLPGLNHLFQTAPTGHPNEYGAIEETISPAALNALSDWLSKIALEAPAPRP